MTAAAASRGDTREMFRIAKKREELRGGGVCMELYGIPTQLGLRQRTDTPSQPLLLVRPAVLGTLPQLGARLVVGILKQWRQSVRLELSGIQKRLEGRPSADMLTRYSLLGGHSAPGTPKH